MYALSKPADIMCLESNALSFDDKTIKTIATVLMSPVKKINLM